MVGGEIGSKSRGMGVAVWGVTTWGAGAARVGGFLGLHDFLNFLYP